MVIFIRIEVPPALYRPGIPIAQTLREITPILETANPLDSGNYLDRLSGAVRAEWTCQASTALEDGF